MADRFVMSHIRRLPMFVTVPDEYLAVISDLFRVTRYEPGEIVFRQGQPAQGMYMLITGRAALLQQTPAGMRTVGMINTNQYLNDAALFQDLIETATFQVVEAAIVLFLPRLAFQSLLASNPPLKASLRLPNNVPVPAPAVSAPAPVRTTPPSSVTTGSVVNTPAAKPVPSQTMHVPAQFHGQRPGENLKLMTRRHWWAYLRRVWFSLTVAAVLFAASVIMPTPGLRLAVLGVMVIIPGLVMLYFYLEWRNDLLIVTDQRIIRYEHTLLTFSSQLNELPLSSIQAVNSEIPASDPFARLFVYGDLVIKTAGRAGTIKLVFVPNPEHVQDIIFQRVNDRSAEVKQKQDAIRTEVNRVLTGDSPSSQPKPAPVKPPRPGLIQSRFINEKGESVYRKHWLFWLRGILTPALVLIGAFVLFALYFVIPALNALGIIILPLVGFILLIGALWFYWSDWDWRNDLYIIGKDTITLIHRRPLWLQNEDDRILINRVDNVTVEIAGLFQSLFKYGDVKIALVGDTGTKLFKSVADPRSVQDEISKRQAATRQAIIDAEERRRREEIASYIAAYDEAKRTGVAPPQPYTPQSYAPPYAPTPQASPGASPTVPSSPTVPQSPPSGTPAPRPHYGSGIPGTRADPNVSPSQQPGTPSGSPAPGSRPPNVPRTRSR